MCAIVYSCLQFYLNSVIICKFRNFVTSKYDFLYLFSSINIYLKVCKELNFLFTNYEISYNSIYSYNSMSTTIFNWKLQALGKGSAPYSLHVFVYTPE